jgi:DNA-binding GntR family transcriptional regulator
MLGATVAMSVQVAARIRDEIDAGEYPPGSRLPGARQLAERHCVHRSTARRALAQLRAEGVAVVRRGIGHFVT